MLKFEKFKSEYFDEYKSWFRDDVIEKALYNIDQEWLDFVLSDKSGMEYAVFLDGELIAVAGIEFSTENAPHIAIKNIAVKPSKFRRGLGSMVLNELFKITYSERR